MLALALCVSAPATPALAQQEYPAGTVREGKLSFDGHGTGGDFTGVTTTVTGEMIGGPLSAVKGHVEGQVATLVTGNNRRDRDLRKSMETDKYPTMRFDLESVSGPTDSADAVLHGRLTIHGVTKDVSLPAKLGHDGTSTRVQTSFPLNLKEYQIGGLSKFLGVFKMDEDIVVHVDVTFGP